MISEERIRQLVKQGFIPKPEKRGFVQLVAAWRGRLRYPGPLRRQHWRQAAHILTFNRATRWGLITSAGARVTHLRAENVQSLLSAKFHISTMSVAAACDAT